MELVQESVEAISQQMGASSAIAELNDMQLMLVGGGNLDVICG